MCLFKINYILGEAARAKFKVAITEAAVKHIPRVERKAKQKWIVEDIFGSHGKKGGKEKMEKITKHSISKSERNEMKPKRCGSITSAETSNYTAEVLSKNIEEISRQKTCSSSGCL